MAEVGVLSLQIHDNSAKAASELDKLASALERVRSAVGSGKQLSGAATEIEKIKTAVSGAVSGEAAKGFAEVAKKIEAVKKASECVKLPELKNSDGFITTESKIEEAITNVGESAVTATKKIETFKDSVREMKRTVEGSGVETIYDPAVKDFVPVDKYSGAGAGSAAGEHAYNGPDPVLADVVKRSGFDSIYEAFPGYRQQMENQFPEMYEAMKNAAGGIEELSESGENAGLNIRQLGEALFGAGDDAKGFGDKINGLFPHLSMLGKQLMSIARRMALRAVIKQVTAGIKEGVENLYWYSKAVGTDFAPAMDSAASAMLQFKNSIGAAAAPVIQALIPVLQTVVNWFITAINYANQFLALITGKSGWTRALPVAADAFEQTGRRARSAGRSAREAAKDVKELLADWDELNIIQSETGGGTGSGGGGGGGAGGTSAEYASMFQEMSSFNADIQAFTRNLEASFGSILELAKKVGVAMLAWKVSSAFGGIVGTLAGLVGTAVALDLVVRMTGTFDNTFLDTGHDGWLIGSLLTPVIGGVFTQQILKTVLKGNVAKLSIPIMLTVSSIVDIFTLAGRTDVSALDEKSLKMSVISALKVGAAAAYFAYTLGGYTLGKSLLGGAAIAIATFGVAIGIKAIAQTVESGITMENIKAAALASLAVGIGAGMFAKIAGASALASLGFGAAAAAITVATLAVGIGIAAIINANKEIKWGKQKLTKEQIESFVNSEMFSIDVNTTAKIITDNVVTPSKEERAAMEEKLSTMLGDWKIIKLGVADKQDYETLQTDVNSLIETIGSYIDTAREAGKLTIQYVPKLAGETEEDQTSWLTDYKKGWDTVDNWATDTGKRIGGLISKAETDSLKEGEAELLETLMGQMSRVTAAIARGKAGSEALGNLIAGVGDIDQASFDTIIEKYKQYQTDLRNSLTAQANEQLSMQGSLMAALYEIDPNSEAYKNAKAKYEEMALGLVASIDDSVREYSKSGQDWLADFLKKKYVDPISRIEAQLGMNGFGDDLASVAESAKSGKFSDNRDLANEIETVIRQQVYYANEELAAYLDKTGLSSWSILEDSTKASIRAAMEAALGDKELVDEIIKMWEGNNPVEEAISGAEEPEVETAATVEATVKENVTYEPVGESVDAGKDAVGNLPESVGQELASTDDVISKHTFPETSTVDTSATTGATGDMAAQVHSDVMSVASDINWLNSMVGGYGYSGIGGAGRPSSVTGVKVYSRATGGNIRSGELFFGNENGHIEMMGKMGNSAVVANNQQIVEGISKGVAASNSGMESAMNMMVALMRQFVSKEFTAKVVPSSSMGRNNAMSNEAYRKVTG